MMLSDERFEPWEEDYYSEDFLDEEDLNFMHYEDEVFNIEILEDNENYYQNLEVQFECCAPIWNVLDVVAGFFEDRGLKTAEIIAMTTEIFDDDTLLLKVIYTC